jgi:hypothetical protein
MCRMAKLIDFLGWYGVVAILGAYALVSFSILAPTNIAYQILNGTGAVAIVLEAGHKRDMQPAVLNGIWAIIALVAIVRMLV